MNLQIAPFGLQVLDPNWLTATGDCAPAQRCVAASDQNAFAVGDVVLDTGATIGGVAVVSSALVQVGTGGTSYMPVGGSLARPGARPLIIVAIAPAVPTSGGTSPVLAAGPKGATTALWVIPAVTREFLIAGDGSTPARAELAGASNAPLTLFSQNVDEGKLFARLRYGAPVGNISGITLDGTSFTDGASSVPNAPGGHGELQVLGLTRGMTLVPRSQYRVRFRRLA